jgi:pheromone a factor receptor
MIGTTVALPAAVFCLCLHLERVSSMRMAQITYRDKRRQQIIDALVCYGIPVVYMTLRMSSWFSIDDM